MIEENAERTHGDCDDEHVLPAYTLNGPGISRPWPRLRRRRLGATPAHTLNVCGISRRILADEERRF